MSKVIDNRVVSMEFDNAKFEQNVQTSMRTLDSLNKTLDNLPDTAGRGLSNLSKAAGNIDLSGISSGIDALNSKFSALGIAGQEVIRDLTRTAINFGKNLWNQTLGQIKSGGISRATNIEQAKFMLEGMGVAFEQVESSINNAVQDTAYGFDEAARAASTLAASGVSLGEDMDHALLAISGVAAMTNRSYSEIADIFSDAASVRVSADTFNRLGERGLAVKQILADMMNTTTAELDKMSKKGQISFKQFSDAMYEAFGAHAKESNDTFQGVTANIRAALSRIGQTFYQPLLSNKSSIVYMLQEVKAKLNEVKKYIDPFSTSLANIVLDLADRAKVLIKNFDLSKIESFFSYLNTQVQKANVGLSFSNIVGGLKEIYKALSPLGKAISTAFREVFPKTSDASIIYDLSKKFAKFAHYLSISSETIDKFKRIFKGVFSLISFEIKRFQVDFKIIGKILEKFKGSGFDVLEFLAKIGDFLTELNEGFDADKAFESLAGAWEKLKSAVSGFSIDGVLNKASDSIKYFFDIIKSSFGSAGGGIAGVISSVFDAIEYAIGKLCDAFQDLTGVDPGDFGDTFIDKLEAAKEAVIEFIHSFDAFGKVKSALSYIKGAFLEFWKTIEPLRTAIVNVLTPLWNVIKQLGKALMDGFKNPVGFLNIASMIVIFEHVRRAISFFIDDIKVLKGLLDKGLKIGRLFDQKEGVLNVIDGARKTLVGLQNELKAKAIIEIAAAIGLLALALMVLASIDSDRLLSATMAMGELLIAVGVLMEVIGRLSAADSLKGTVKSVLTINQLSTAMIKIAAAVLILAVAMKALDSCEHILEDMLAVIIMMAALTAIAMVLDQTNTKSFGKVAGSMILMAIAVKILASAMKAFDGLDPTTIVLGLMSIITLIIVLAGVSIMLNELMAGGSFIKGAAGMILMAAAVKILASATAQLAKLDPDALAQGLLAVIGLMGMLGIIAMGISMLIGTTDFLKVGTGFLMLGLAVGVLALALKTIASIDPDKINMALWALAMTLGMFIVTCTLLQDKLVQAGAGLLLMAAGMLVVAMAVKSFGSMDLGVLVQGVLGFAACMAVFAVALKLIQGSIAGAAALLIVSIALVPFALALKILTELDLLDLAGTILAMCVALAALVVVCYAMTGAIVGAAALIVLSAALLIFGVACAMLTALPLGDLAATLGVVLLALVAFSVVSTILSVLTPFIIAFAAGMIVFGAALLVVGAALVVFGIGLEMFAATGVVAATALSMFCEVLSKNVMLLGEAAIVFAALAAALILFDAALIVAAVSITASAIALGLLTLAMLGFSAAAGVFVAALKLITVGLKDCIKELKTMLVEKDFKDITTNAVTGIQKGFKEGISKAVSAAKELGQKVVDAIKSFGNDMKTAGANAVNGFINGLKSKLSSVGSAAKTLGSTLLNKLKSSLKEKSPSKATLEMGENVDKGLILGIKNKSGAVVHAAEDLGNDTVSAMSKVLDIVSNAMNSDAQPTITPVLDLSEIQNGVNSMNSLIDADRATNISANYNANRMSEMEQMAYNQAQLNRFGNQLAGLVSQLQSQEPTPVDVNVTLAGEADGVFKLVEKVNNRYIKMHGKSALA